MEVVRALLRWTAFPTVLVAAVAGSAAAIGGGVYPPLVILPAYLFCILAVAGLERVIPYRADWNHSHGDLAADAVYLPATFGVGALMQPLVATLAVALAGWLSGALGTGLWPEHWPLAAQVALACVVAELFDYGAHRAMHESAWLWRFHAIHHSAPRLYWLNATRTHPGEAVFRGFLGALPLAVCGVGAPVLALWAVLGRVAGVFQHGNVDFALGPFSWLFSIGELHRWHHSTRVAEANRNYGNTFIFWDTVFRTRYLPADRRGPAQIGIDGLAAFPRRLPQQLLAPFRWRRIEAESAALSGGASS